MADIPRTTNDSTLYDENGNPVAVILDGTIYRIAVDSKIKDGFLGTNEQVGVNADGELLVSASSNPTFPPPGTDNQLQYYSKLLGTTGADSGNTDMSINGSGTPVEFYIDAEATFDIRVMNIVITIIDGNIKHSRFGQINNVPNGWDLLVQEGGVDTFVIQKAQTVGEILRNSGTLEFFGKDKNLNVIRNYSGNNDALVVNIPINQYIPGGFRIGINGIDKIKAVVNDNFNGLVDMTVRVLGYKHLQP